MSNKTNTATALQKPVRTQLDFSDIAFNEYDRISKKGKNAGKATATVFAVMQASAKNPAKESYKKLNPSLELADCKAMRLDDIITASDMTLEVLTHKVNAREFGVVRVVQSANGKSIDVKFQKLNHASSGKVTPEQIAEFIQKFPQHPVVVKYMAALKPAA